VTVHQRKNLCHQNICFCRNQLMSLTRLTKRKILNSTSFVTLLLQSQLELNL